MTGLAAGVHRQQGRSRVRVAVVLDLLVLAPSSGSSDAGGGRGKGKGNAPPPAARTETLRVVAVYQWGYAGLSGGRRPVALQNVLGPPSPNAGVYVASSLCVADGLLFLAGTCSATPSGRPCVFLAKPQVRDAWSVETVADALPPAKGRTIPVREVSAIAVTAHPHRSYQYLAVALLDGTLSIWTYDLAVTTNRISAATGGGGGGGGTGTGNNGKNSSNNNSSNEKAQKLLQPLCRLEGWAVLESLPRTLPLTESGGAVEGAVDPKPPLSTHCTHLSFLPPNPASSSLLLLAAAFPDGLAVYHVSLPLIMDLRPIPTDSISELSATSDEPPATGFAVQGRKKRNRGKNKAGSGGAAVATQGGDGKKQPTLAQTVSLSPFAAARGCGATAAAGARVLGKATTSWLDLGPRCPPCLALAVETAPAPTSVDAPMDATTTTTTRVLLCAVDLPLYGSPVAARPSPSDGPRPIRALCARTLPPAPSGLVDVSAAGSTGGLLCHRGDDGELVALSPSLKSSSSSSRRPRSSSAAAGEDAHFASLSRPVASPALGLDSEGSILSGESSAGDDVLHVYSVLQCRRRNLRDLPLSSPASPTSPSSSGGNGGKGGGGERLDWSTPVLRHWLCRASPGDRRRSDARSGREGGSGGGGGGGGGAHSDGLSASQVGDEVATGGADTCVVCELTCGESCSTALTPQRIVREGPGGGGRHCAVLFASVLGGGGGGGKGGAGDSDAEAAAAAVGVSPDPIAFAVLDASVEGGGAQNTFKLHRGRDVAFLQRSGGTEEDGGAAGDAGSVVVLNGDGRSARVLRWTTSASAADGGGGNDGTAEDSPFVWRDGASAPIFRDGDPETDSLGARRIFALSSSSPRSSSGNRETAPPPPPPRLLFAASRQVDGRSCLLLGRRPDPSRAGAGGDDDLLPDLMPRENGRGPRLWLGDGEELISLVELPRDEGQGRGPPCLAIATQRRVAILSGRSLAVLAEAFVRPTCGSLVPIGSSCVAFCSASTSGGGGDAKIRYLSRLRGGAGAGSRGIIATIPTPRFGYAPYLLLGLRPDRLLYLSSHRGTRLVEHGEDENMFLSPIAVTRPAFPLEPLVANALCWGMGDAGHGGGGGDAGAGAGDLVDDVDAQELLRGLIERFGRKTTPFPHGEGEGIGTLGTGLTAATYEMLVEHGCQDAATFLLTGNAVRGHGGHAAHDGKMLPPWVPMATKARCAGGIGDRLQALAGGDRYLSEYVRDPGSAAPSGLPRPSDPTSALARDLALEALARGNASDAMRLLDLSGGASSEGALLLATLSLQLRPDADAEGMLRALAGGGLPRGGEAKENRGSGSSIAAIALDLKHRRAVPQHWMRQLAPSVQGGRDVVRERNRLIAHDVIASAARNKEGPRDSGHPWQRPPDESKHFWSKGPFDQKEELLLLDRFEEWLGRRRPTIVGKEGAAAAAESGEKALADILLAAARDRDDVDDDEEDSDSIREGWVEGIGEGHNDEDNLSAYFRFSEGGDEDSTWRSDGVNDLTKFQNTAIVFASDAIGLEATTSSADEGEAGKVRLLYDLVFNEDTDRDRAAGMLIEVKRGTSLDVGMLHGADHDSRRRCTIEFWYHLPSSISDEIVLMRRSVSSDDEDLSKLCVSSAVEEMLWELVVKPNGRLEFRSSGGTVLTSHCDKEKSDTSGTENAPKHHNDQESDDEVQESGLVSWQREDGYGGWNHVCLTFNSRFLETTTDCSITLMMKGIAVASTVASVVPPGLEPGQSTEFNEIDEAMERTALMFGLGAPGGFRMTEVRAWSCERSEEDVKMMMYEYLRAAEIKKKFKIKIRNRQSSPKKAIGGFLAPPKTGKVVRLAQPEQGKKPLFAPPAADSKKKHEKSDEGEETKETADTAATKTDNFGFDVSFDTFGGDKVSEGGDKGSGTDAKTEGTPTFTESPFATDFGVNEDFSKHAFPSEDLQQSTTPDESMTSTHSLIVETTSLLSKQVRNSAAAAIIRGPPATRHFGGNRGGLAKSSAKHRRDGRRIGVGSIAICGAEKTVIYTHDQSPPGKTYPIGASGAIISDILDSEGSEYLCCFLAKEKRMVVFELLSKTVVVELQMTTKLNFWRYLPPEAHGNTLVFMLITPVGGFHWMPLDESPRPRQAWKRAPELQGKKIVSYEEGGSNGLEGPERRSSVALLLVSSSTAGSPVEAWCLPVYCDSGALLLSEDILGAAFARPSDLENGPEEFLPLLVTATKGDETNISIDVRAIKKDPSTYDFEKGDIMASAVLEEVFSGKSDVPAPTMAMGTLPPVHCCCLGDHIVVIVRNTGLVSVYEFSGDELSLVGQKDGGQYVIDAAVRAGTSEGETEIVLLLCDPENTKDGRVATITVSPCLAIC